MPSKAHKAIPQLCAANVLVEHENHTKNARFQTLLCSIPCEYTIDRILHFFAQSRSRTVFFKYIREDLITRFSEGHRSTSVPTATPLLLRGDGGDVQKPGSCHEGEPREGWSLMTVRHEAPLRAAEQYAAHTLDEQRQATRAAQRMSDTGQYLTDFALEGYKEAERQVRAEPPPPPSAGPSPEGGLWSRERIYEFARWRRTVGGAGLHRAFVRVAGLYIVARIRHLILLTGSCHGISLEATPHLRKTGNVRIV